MDFTAVLPFELSVCIFEHLTEGDLESAGLVSREWRRAATEPALWRGLFCRVARVDRPSRTDHADWRRDALLQPALFARLKEKVMTKDIHSFSSLIKHGALEADSHSGSLITRQVMLNLLIEHNADLNIRANDGQTPLHLSVKGRNLSLTELLVNKGASTAIFDNEGVSPIALATKLNLQSFTKFFESKCPNAMLCQAVKECNFELVRKLVQDGYDLSEKDQNWKTPLHWAAEKMSPDTVRLLLDYGADIGAKNKDGQTPPHYAAYMGSLPVMQVMIEKTGDHSLVHWTNKHMETVFAYACHWGHVELAKYMLGVGADPTSVDSWLNTPVFHAALSGCVELMQTLLADERTHPLVAKANSDGDTPYGYTKENGNSAMLALFHERCPQHCPAPPEETEVITTSLDHGLLLDA